MINPIRRYSRNGNTLVNGNQSIEIRQRDDGSRFLFQESPSRKYLSGLKPRPEYGGDVFQIDFKLPDGTREYYLLWLGDDVAIVGTGMYNNTGSGHVSVRREKRHRSRERS